jgi:hypothetical protein
MASAPMVSIPITSVAFPHPCAYPSPLSNTRASCARACSRPARAASPSRASRAARLPPPPSLSLSPSPPSACQPLVDPCSCSLSCHATGRRPTRTSFTPHAPACLRSPAWPGQARPAQRKPGPPPEPLSLCPRLRSLSSSAPRMRRRSRTLAARAGRSRPHTQRGLHSGAARLRRREPARRPGGLKGPRMRSAGRPAGFHPVQRRNAPARGPQHGRPAG